MSNLAKCDESVTSRLVIENEDKGCWTVANLLEHFSIPITYDNLHDKCNPDEYLDDAAYKCARTWGNVKPLFHYSESMPDHKNPRKHADMPTDYPFSNDFDWDIELKSKDAAIRELAMIELVRQSEEMGLYDTQIKVANEVMEEDKEVLIYVIDCTQRVAVQLLQT
jgi:UV DNA damage repair endonuclease